MEARKLTELNFFRAILALDALLFHTFFYVTRKNFVVLDNSKYNFELYKPSFAQVLSLSVLFNAIPAFFLLSLFLYGLKYSSKSSYLFKKIIPLFKLLLFWTGIYMIYMLLFQETNFFPELLSLKSIVFLIITGGHSLYWFFFSLIFLLVLLHFYLFLIEKYTIKIKIQFLLLILSLPFIYISVVLFERDFFANPLPFIPLIFLTPIFLFYHKKDISRNKTNKLALILALFFILFSILDWLLVPYFADLNFTYFVLPFYCRPSIFIGTSLLFVLVLFYKPKPSKFILFISKYSLAIYCLHLYTPYKETLAIALKDLHCLPIIVDAIIFTYMVLFSIALGAVLKKVFFIKKFL